MTNKIRVVSSLLQTRFSARNPAIVKSLVLRNQQIIDDLHLQFQLPDAPNSAVVSVPLHDQHHHRPRSPAKLFSSFLEGRPGAKKLQPAFALSDPPILRPFQPSKPLSSHSSRPTSRDDLAQRPESAPSAPSSSRPGSAPQPATVAPASPSRRLEETMSAYFLALQARKGNIVGKIVQARSRANELSVNELYNSLLEDPNMMVVAAQSSIDVLFASFEKFLKVAWKEHCGPIVTVTQLKDVQAKAESLFPVDFQKYFKDTFHHMSIQNQRALRGFVKLLAELLDGTGNDGDRGMLTAAFVEILVPEGEPYEFVSLLDRFVEDMESLFGEVVQVRDIQPPPAINGSTGSRHARSRSVNTSSLTSNTSSLRRKFGFSTLGRENSKSEQESKVGSVFRALSKSTRMPDQSSSLSRAPLQRAQSSDPESRLLPTRPSSHDQPPSTPTSLDLRPRSHDSTSIVTQGSSPGGLRSIQEAVSPEPKEMSKKKRRSSLSDLKTLEMAIGGSPFMSPSTMLRFDSETQEETPLKEPSHALSPTPNNKTTAFSTPTRITGLSLGTSQFTPQSRSRLPSSFRKENSPRPDRANSTTTRPRSISKLADEVVITPYNGGSIRRGEFPSAIPSLRSTPNPQSTPSRVGLSERPTTGNAMKIKLPPTPKPLKPSTVGSVKRPSTAESQPNSAARPPLSLRSMTSPAARKESSEVMSPTPGTATRKLRMQSPQKLRERLQDEQRAISNAHSTLQDELSKIGEEMSSRGPGRMGSVRGHSVLSPPPGFSRTRSNTSTAVPSIPETSPLASISSSDPLSRLKSLEDSLPSLFGGLQDRVVALSGDITTSLTVSETKARRLDDLYREANAENEALYSKVNEELGRVLRGVRGGDGVGEIRRKLKESQEEEGRLRRENARLKREVLGLRSQLRE